MNFERGLIGMGLLVGLLGLVPLPARSQRLPGGVRPVHYSLTIAPDLQAATFSGTETIEVVLDAPADTITLNAAEIKFGVVRAVAGPDSSASPRNDRQNALRNDRGAQNDGQAGGPADSSAQTATVTLDAAKEQATFDFAHPLAAGPVTLQIAYTGILNDKLRGFYLSKTKLRRYGVTQFEPTDARRAFPCFDEPALKATFNVSLVIDSGDTAISNTKIVSDTQGPTAGKHTLAFATTPKMSTYLVAWLVGDFQCTEGKSDGVPIRACATPDKVGLTNFALDAAKWDLHYYDKYFGIKYPLAKLDMIAVPDFEAGAMENFGCITYRETEMLVDAKHGALDAKKQVAETVAHEISHQWFGDLVTPDWWDNLWLNEGFATWMETKAAAEWHPKWEYAEDVAVDKDRTMNEDASSATRAIRTNVETPAEINETFDDIAYGKAGAVLAMVENWVGEDVFRRGVQAYLAAHLYGNATGEDFWDAQTRVSGLPVDKVMRSFVEQPGVPLVSIGDEPAASEDFHQQRFLLAPPSAATTLATAEQWTIPLCRKTASRQDCRLILPASNALASVALDPSVDLRSPLARGVGLDASSGFLYANAKDKGYYRTAYGPAQLTAIEANAEAAFSVPERIGLVGDQWALMRAGENTAGQFLDLVLNLRQDASPAVMELALDKVDTIKTRIATAEDRRQLDALLRQEFGPVYAALGGMSRHETTDHARLRETLFEALGRAQDAGVLAQAQAETKQLLAGKKPADPMLADAAVALATAKGDSAMYDSLLKVSRATGDPDLKETALAALTRFEEPVLVIRTLEYALSGEVRSQDSFTLIALLLERPATQDLAWQFVEQHWRQIAGKVPVDSGTRVVEAAGSFCSIEKRDEVEDFFRDPARGASQRSLLKSIDSINACIRMRTRQEPQLRRWLDRQQAGR